MIFLLKKPDMIFIHDIGKISLAYTEIKKYKRKINPACVVVGDIHNDYYNTPSAKDESLTVAGKGLLFVRRWFFK